MYRIICGVLLATTVLSAPAGALAQTAAPATAPATTWAVTLNQTTLYSAPSDQAEDFGDIPPLVTLQVLGYEGDWAHVFNPRTQTVAFVPSDQLGASDAPSRYVTMPAPKPIDEFTVRGVLTDAAPLT